MDLINKLFDDIELEKKEYKKDIEISLNEVNRVLEKNKFMVQEYAVTSGTSIKYTGNDLIEAYRQYNEWDRTEKNIVYAKIEKGIFMDIEMVIDLKVLKKIK
ncbi:hypothetical protein N496_19940 (plasmid) [Clostridium botulinum A2B3 87]|uniref:hypothetical protein n=1 Tax=Clostridium botulinum TaxID=1491 RepID=UPI0004A59BAD|nr:hypothetical protein [Clostridium botulinum]KEI94406.1 hypothetical protein N496_19940 [Clostridium botulinum A2B3 87]